MPRTIGIVGYGSFGILIEELVRRFAPGVAVRVHSSRFEPDGKKFFNLADVAQCDVVVLAVPIRTYEEMLQKILPHVRPDTVLVDVATVKMHTTALLKRLAPAQPYLATHPMFGPESLKKRMGDVHGLRIVVAESALPAEQLTAFVAFLKQCGFDVVEMSAEVHDKHLAETLFLTHFVGQTVARASFARSEIDTVSFGYLMDAVESVQQDTELFKDVYRFNPYCEEVLKRFEAAEQEVHDLLKKA